MIWVGFSRSEFACKCGCGFATVDAELLEVLKELKRYFNGATVNISSGCRCKAYNTKIGGSAKSRHMRGTAADITVKGVAPKQVADYLESMYPNRYGIGRYNTFTHIDTDADPARRPARWGSN